MKWESKVVSRDDGKWVMMTVASTPGGDGGFVLSTGDQCGRDTPFENIFEIVRVAKEFGTYPLDLDKIREEIKRLEK